MNKKALTTTGLLVAVALFLSVHMFSSWVFRTSRIDLTENDLYTLSQGTKNILRELKEPITLRFYLSQHLVSEVPGIAGYTSRVREMLDEYSRYAGSELKLLVIDPEPFSDEEDRAESEGLQGVPINSGSDNFYFGLVGTNSTDDKEDIPFFSPERSEFLENDLTKLVYKLANPKQLVVGVMSTLPIDGGGQQAMMMPGQRGPSPWVIMQQIQQSFDVKKIDTKAESIPAEVAVLMLVHPRELSDKTLYAIDQFVMRGGRLLAFVDPYAEAQQTNSDPNNFMANMQVPRNSELKKLLDAWGVEMAAGDVAADSRAAIQVQFNESARPVLYPVYMNIQPEQMNQDDIITKKLGQIMMASAGVLKKKEGTDITFTPLLETSSAGMKVSTTKLGMFSRPEEIMREYRPEGKFALAARITGKLKSAFPGGAPAGDSAASAQTNEKDKAAHLAETKDPANIVLIADADFLQDRFWVRVQNILGTTIASPTAANNTLVVNAIENLVGSNDLISVRNRGTFTRPFTKVKELQRDAEQQFLQKANMLQSRLKEIENNLKSLESQKDNRNSLILSDEQKTELQKYVQERINIRKELRNVQHNLNKNIESLESWLIFFNVAFVPLLIMTGAVGYYRVKRRKIA